MRKVAVVTDSSANLPPGLTERYRIFVVPLLVHMAGKSYRDSVDLMPSDVYRYMSGNEERELPTTSASSTDEFVRAYVLASQEADEVVSIHAAAELSATHQVACVASELVDAQIHVVDSRNAAMGLGFAVLEAARLADIGASADEVIRRAREIGQSARFMFTLDRMDYLHRGGRVPAIAVPITSALKLCPILNVEGGQVKIVQVTRTRPRAVRRILRLLERDVAGSPVHIAVVHADILSEAQRLLDEVIQRFSCTESYITELTPVMGVHTGPGLLGVAYHKD